MSKRIWTGNSQINIAKRANRSHTGRSALVCGALALACFANAAKADEGGVSFWIPGFFGSLAATPQQPGMSLTANIYYHTTYLPAQTLPARARSPLAKFRSISPANLSANLNATGPTSPIHPELHIRNASAGRPAQVRVIGTYGRVGTSLAGTLAGSLGTPFGNIPFMRSDSISDSVWGFGESGPAV